MSDEFEHEPVPGLPEHLPEGEKLLWQGSPDWLAVARHVMHVRGIVIYFLLLAAWSGGSTYTDGAGAQEAWASALRTVLAGVFTVGAATLIAWLIGRTTVYTITSKRVAMRYGVALPMRVNLPFSKVSSADLLMRRNGVGEIALTISGPQPLAYWHLWPHARPWHLGKAAPMLRCVPNAEAVADMLARAVAGDTRVTPVSGATIETGSHDGPKAAMPHGLPA